MRLAPAILCLLLAGCVGKWEQPTTHTTPTGGSLVLSNDLAPFVDDWRREAEAVLGVPCFIIAGHGLEMRGDWWIIADLPMLPSRVSDLVAGIRERIGDAVPIVLVVCNPGGVLLEGGNVWYSHRMLWAKPGGDVRREPGGNARDCEGQFADFRWSGE